MTFSILFTLSPQVEWKVDEDRIFYSFVHCLHTQLNGTENELTLSISFSILFLFSLYLKPGSFLRTSFHTSFLTLDFFPLRLDLFSVLFPSYRGPEWGWVGDLLVPHWHTQTILIPSVINCHCLEIYIIRLDHFVSMS